MSLVLDETDGDAQGADAQGANARGIGIQGVVKPHRGPEAGSGIHPDVHPGLLVLTGLLDMRPLVRASAHAKDRGTCPLAELIAAGMVAEDEAYAAIARACELPFAHVDPARVLLAAGTLPEAGDRTLRCSVPRGDALAAVLHVAPNADGVARLARGAARGPVIVTTPSSLRDAIAACRRREALRRAVDDLRNERPSASAARTVTGWQGALLAGSLFALMLGFVRWPGTSWFVVNCAMSVLFAGCLALRVLATRHARSRRGTPLPTIRGAELPTYSVLVALHREEAVVPQLIAHLNRLRWPRTKLDICLVCEADDAGTIAAIERHGLPPHMRIVRVPPGEPRTKPKALNVAADGTTGELLVLYDAEDRPHPLQLLEAYAAFRDGPDALACVQAPLQIDNGSASLLARGFALEYAALFRGLLPWMARHGLPLPLGGTSNHFRRAALDAVGRWDPFNVTEDADLGLRLARAGYVTGVLERPTLEAAPETFAVWLPQRTRWLKGWMQTWLVHMRDPRGLWHAVGPAGFATVQLVTIGMMASVLLHPFLLGALGFTVVTLMGGIEVGRWGAALLSLDIACATAGHVVFVGLARAVLARRERWLLKGWLVQLPVYWMALGIAGWRALLQLMSEPHRWEKTPHMPSPATPRRTEG